MKKNEKLKIEERGNHATLEARLHIDENHAQGLRKKAETYYDQDGIGELYKIRTSSFKELISPLKTQKKLNELKESELYNTSKTSITLHTQRGYLRAKIKSKSGNYMINVKSEGTTDFVKEFYKYLRDISYLQPPN